MACCRKRREGCYTWEGHPPHQAKARGRLCRWEGRRTTSAARITPAHLCLPALALNAPSAARGPGQAGPAALSCPTAASELGSSWESAVEKELLILQGSFPGTPALAVPAQVGQTRASLRGFILSEARRQPDWPVAAG